MATRSGRWAAICSASFSIERPAASAATRKRSGNAATTSSVERPIEPVEPRMDRVFMDNPAFYLQAAGDERGEDRGREEKRVDPVVEPPVTGQKCPGVLDSRAPLPER